MESLKINIFQSALLGGGHKKEHPVRAVDDIEQYERPLKYTDFTNINASFWGYQKNYVSAHNCWGF